MERNESHFIIYNRSYVTLVGTLIDKSIILSKEWVNNRVDEWVCLIDWVSEELDWLIDWLSEWVSECVREWVSEWERERERERDRERESEWLSEWVSEWVTEWSSTRLKPDEKNKDQHVWAKNLNSTRKHKLIFPPFIFFNERVLTYKQMSSFFTSHMQPWPSMRLGIVGLKCHDLNSASFPWCICLWT